VATLAPLAVTTGEPRDSSATRFAFGAGAGNFAVVTRGCDNSVISKYHSSFRDAGGSVSHEFRGPLVVGVRGQRVTGDYLGERTFWNPNVSLEWRGFGIGGGWVTPSGNGEIFDVYIPPASGHLRFGNPRHLAISFRVMEGEPYFSSGGAFDVRATTQIGSRIRPWIGVGGDEPFDKAGLLVGAEARLAPGWNLSLGGRLGSSEGLDENAIRAGLSYTWTHRRYDFAPAPAPLDSILPSRFTLTLDGGRTLSIASAEPGGLDYVKVVTVDGREEFFSTARIRSIVDKDGNDVKKRVVIERRKIP
jgi:hypothetical protein